MHSRSYTSILQVVSMYVLSVLYTCNKDRAINANNDRLSWSESFKLVTLYKSRLTAYI